MTESDIHVHVDIMMNGDTHTSAPTGPLPSHSEEVVKANGVAKPINTFIKPQISIESVDDVNDLSPPSMMTIRPSGTDLSATLELSTSEMDCTDSTNTGSANLCVNQQTHVYPKTPPANYKFHSPSSKFEKSGGNHGEDSSEEDSGPEEGRGVENRKENAEHSLQVLLSNSPCSRSLPKGIKMDTNRISSNSDETVESEGGGSPVEKHKRVKCLDHLIYQERLDSAGSDISPPESSDDSSFEGPGEEDKINGDISPSGIEQEDDIFIESDIQEQADTKLIDWACNDFVPACHQLLSQCSKSERSAQIKSANIQANLRSLSNTITFFCSEQQQRLSQVFQLRPGTPRGNNSPSSPNTQTFPRPLKNAVERSGDDAGGDRSYAVKVLRSVSQSLIAPLMVQASQRQGFTPGLHQDIIKALQKISWKVEACISFSNSSRSVEIHEKIFDAKHIDSAKKMMIQALPPAEPLLRTVPLPPPRHRKSSEPNFSSEILQPAPLRRGQSVKERLFGEGCGSERETPDLQCIGELEGDDEVWKEDGQKEGDEEGKGEGGGERNWEEAGEEDEQTTSDVQPAEPSENEEVIEEEQVVETSPLMQEDSREGTPNLPRRERIATEGEADLMSKSQLVRKSVFGSIPNLDREEDVSNCVDDRRNISRRERYFRPRAFRRTTVSLSRKEVQTLGLTVAKRVDESILDDIRVQREQEAAQRRSCKQQEQRGSKSEEKAPPTVNDEKTPSQMLELEVRSPAEYGINNAEDLDKVGKQLHNTLTKRFDLFRSASMSDIVDCDDDMSVVSSTPDPSNSDRESETFSPLPNQRLELVAQDNKRPVYTETTSSTTAAVSSQPVSPNFQKSYTPLRRGTLIPSSSSSDWVMVEAEKRKRSVKGRAKATVKKSLSTSGRLAHSLLRTAKALRSSSAAKIQQQQMTKSLSAADLLDESTAVHPQSHTTSCSARLSLSIASPPPTPYDVATLPSRNKRMNTLARIIRRGRESRSRSFGKSDKYVPMSCSFAQDDFSNRDRSFAESIETVSRNAIHSMAIESEEQLLISVDMATKIQKKQAIHNRSSTGKESSNNPWFQISVNTNIKQFGRQDYTILRPFKEIQLLIDSLSACHGAVDLHVPRLDKKSGAKKQMKAMEDLLRSIAGNTRLRSTAAFVSFLTPDDQFGRFSESGHSEVSFERLMTFYTPDLSSGPPGSFPSVQIVPPEHVPAAPVVDAPHKSSLTSGHKKGSMHYMKKKDGKEDTSTFVIQEEGEDALIVACEDDHYVVVAGTFEKLVEQLACEEKPDARFVTTFLLGYRHFATTMEFLTKLLERFHMRLPPNPTDEEMAYAEKWSYVIQLRVLDILTYWIKKCWPDIYRQPPVLEKLKEFATFLRATDDHNFQYAGTNIQKIIKEKMASSARYCQLPPDTGSPSPFTSSHSPTSSLRDHHHLTTPRGTRGAPPSHTRHHEQVKRTVTGPPRSAPSSPLHHVERLSSSGSYATIDVCSLPAIQLARQLTLIELEFLRAIDVHELVVFTWDPNTAENKPYRRNLDAFIERFNKVSYWVASEICCVEDVRLRGILLEKFIEVAKYCHEFKNYNTTISVLSGLSLAAVRRLKRSWDLVNEKTRKWFTKLQPLTSPTTNHSNYRRALATVHKRDNCIPYLGVFMRDLTFFNDGNTKRLKNGLYNFSKLRTMVYKFEELKRYQRSKYSFPPEDKIQEFCRHLWCLSESELYDASLQTEPREETDI